jgi:hypothetical protein
MAKKRAAGGLMKNVNDAAALTVGAAVASKIGNINLPVPAQLKPLLPVLLGVFLMKRGGFIGNVGAGMVAIGGTQVIKAVAPQLGIGADESISEYVIEGAEDYALAGPGENVSGYGSSYALSGMPQSDDTNSDFAG